MGVRPESGLYLGRKETRTFFLTLFHFILDEILFSGADRPSSAAKFNAGHSRAVKSLLTGLLSMAIFDYNLP